MILHSANLDADGTDMMTRIRSDPRWYVRGKHLQWETEYEGRNFARFDFLCAEGKVGHTWVVHESASILV